MLAVLAGVPLHQAAAQVAMKPAALVNAVELYQAAGRAALEAQTGPDGWRQADIEFAEWNTAEQAAATHLGPQMKKAEATGVVSSWWFIRKAPCWRLRWRRGPAVTPARLTAFTEQLLDAMLSRCLIVTWRETIYEPETCAFGGPAAMATAHRLFHADSNGIVDYLSRHDPTALPGRAIGRRELSVLLCSVMLRGAAQDWYEQGDVWNRVAEHRPIPPGAPTGRLPDIRPRLLRLMTVSAGRASKLFKDDGPLASAANWAAAFDDAGKTLTEKARNGELTRGLRDVLAHHVIFHWNRMGLSAQTQSILAVAAREVIFQTRPEADRRSKCTRPELPADLTPSRRQVHEPRVARPVASSPVRTGGRRSALRDAGKVQWHRFGDGPVVDLVVSAEDDQLGGSHIHWGRWQRAQPGESLPDRRRVGVGVAVGEGDVGAETIRRLRHVVRSPHVGDGCAECLAYPLDRGPRTDLHRYSFREADTGSDVDGERRQLPASGSGPVGDRAQVAGGDLVGESDALHGQVQTGERNRVKRGNVGQLGVVAKDQRV